MFYVSYYDKKRVFLDYYMFFLTDPPSRPFIHGYTEGSHIPVGTVQKIACTSTGGNPLAIINWYKNDKKIHSIFKNTDKSVTSEITVITNISDNEAIYRCEAGNSATEQPLSASIKMSVYCMLILK